MPPDPVPKDVIVTPGGTPEPVIVIPTTQEPVIEPVRVSTLLIRVQLVQVALDTQHRLYTKLIGDIALELLHEWHAVLAGRICARGLHAL